MHAGSFDLTDTNKIVIPATHEAFSAKHEKVKITVRDNKIAVWIVVPTEGAGLMAGLEQRGYASRGQIVGHSRWRGIVSELRRK